MVTIRVDFARARLVDSSKSEAFVNELRKLEETCCFSRGSADPRPRFSPRTVAGLGRDLIARGPGLRDAVFQLTHLLRAAAALAPHGTPMEVLFTLEGPALPRPIAAGLAPWLEGRDDVGRIEGETLLLAYESGRDPYALPLKRLPLLLALYEFLLGVDLEGDADPERMRVLDDIAAAPARLAELRPLSNALARVLNGHLDALVGARTARERLIAVARYLDETAEEGDVDGAQVWHIDDDAVLGFWESQAVSGSHDMRLFRTVHRAFVALLAALRHGQDWWTLHEGAADIDALPSAAEPDPAASVVGEGPPSPLDRLAEPPAGAVKFLNKREREQLELVDTYWRPCQTLPLSVLRSAVMGGHQSAITTARQFGRPIDALLSLDAGAEGVDYAGQAEQWQALGTHVERVRLAAAHVLAHHMNVTLPAQADEARKAFRGLGREGFRDALENPERRASFAAAIEPLVELSVMLRRLQDAMPGDLDGLCAGDRERFETVFRALYQERELT